MFDSLLLLKQTRDSLQDWFQLTSNSHQSTESPTSEGASSPKTPKGSSPSPSAQSSTASSFFSSLLGRKSSSSALKSAPTTPNSNEFFNKAPALLKFLDAFYQSLLGKFALYFHDTLSPYAPGGELKC